MIFQHMLPNGEPSDQPTTTESLACKTDCHAILPNQHTQQLQESHHAIPQYQNLENDSEIFDQKATSNEAPSIEEQPNIFSDMVEDQGHNVNLEEREDFTNLFNYTNNQLEDLIEELRIFCEVLSWPLEDEFNIMEFTQINECM